MQIALQRIFITSTQRGSKTGLPDPYLCRLDLDSLLPDGTFPTFPPKRFALDFHKVVLFPTVKGLRFGDFCLPASTL